MGQDVNELGLSGFMTAPVRPPDLRDQGADRPVAGKPDPAVNEGVVIDLLDKPVYSMGQTDRLLRVSDGTSRRWIDGYESRGKVYDPLIREARTGLRHGDVGGIR